MSAIREICSSQAEEWAILIDVAKNKFIKKISEHFEDESDIPSNFITTVGELFKNHRDAETLCELMKYLLVKFEGEMSNKGFKITGSNHRSAIEIQVLIYPDIRITMRESMAFVEPAVKCFDIECQKKRKRASEKQSASAAPAIRECDVTAIEAAEVLELREFPVFGNISPKIIRDYANNVTRECQALRERCAASEEANRAKDDEISELQGRLALIELELQAKQADLAIVTAERMAARVSATKSKQTQQKLREELTGVRAFMSPMSSVGDSIRLLSPDEASLPEPPRVAYETIFFGEIESGRPVSSLLLTAIGKEVLRTMFILRRILQTYKSVQSQAEANAFLDSRSEARYDRESLRKLFNFMLFAITPPRPTQHSLLASSDDEESDGAQEAFQAGLREFFDIKKGGLDRVRISRNKKDIFSRIICGERVEHDLLKLLCFVIMEERKIRSDKLSLLDEETIISAWIASTECSPSTKDLARLYIHQDCTVRGPKEHPTYIEKQIRYCYVRIHDVVKYISDSYKKDFSDTLVYLHRPWYIRPGAINTCLCADCEDCNGIKKAVQYNEQLLNKGFREHFTFTVLKVFILAFRNSLVFIRTSSSTTMTVEDRRLKIRFFVSSSYTFARAFGLFNFAKRPTEVFRGT
jgi:hypothetical protein